MAPLIGVPPGSEGAPPGNDTLDAAPLGSDGLDEAPPGSDGFDGIPPETGAPEGTPPGSEALAVSFGSNAPDGVPPGNWPAFSELEGKLPCGGRLLADGSPASAKKYGVLSLALGVGTSARRTGCVCSGSANTAPMLRRSPSLGGGALGTGGELRKPGVGGPACDVETPKAPGAAAVGPGLGGKAPPTKGPTPGGAIGGTPPGGVSAGAPKGAPLGGTGAAMEGTSGP
jgi:hypothetical protein